MSVRSKAAVDLYHIFEEPLERAKAKVVSKLRGIFGGAAQSQDTEAQVNRDAGHRAQRKDEGPTLPPPHC